MVCALPVVCATIVGVTTALLYLVVMALVAAVVFLLASLLFGRGEEMAPLPPGASPTRLPADRVTPEDVRALRFQLVLRGYKMSEVDWALGRLAGEVERLRERVAELEELVPEGALRDRDAAESAEIGPGVARPEKRVAEPGVAGTAVPESGAAEAGTVEPRAAEPTPESAAAGTEPGGSGQAGATPGATTDPAEPAREPQRDPA
ncbi:DivIVA domain-containing protein [Actinosynnema pretiosum]|nr:DivIVA domain-containing protein [Actinosynnema pretiosum]